GQIVRGRGDFRRQFEQLDVRSQSALKEFRQGAIQLQPSAPVMNCAFQKADRAKSFRFRAVEELPDSRGNYLRYQNVVRPRRSVQQMAHHAMPFHSDLSTGAGGSGMPFDKSFPAPE